MRPKAPLCKGGWQIADFRQFGWGIVVFLQSLRPKSKILATSLYTREARAARSICPLNSNLRNEIKRKQSALRTAFCLHICFNSRDQDIAGDHTVFCGEAVGKIVGIDHLGIGGEFLIALSTILGLSLEGLYLYYMKRTLDLLET